MNTGTWNSVYAGEMRLDEIAQRELKEYKGNPGHMNEVKEIKKQ